MEKQMDDYYFQAQSVMDEVRRAVIGKDEVVRKAMAAIIAGGHILIDDIPGVGKTTLALSFARAMELTSQRVQFTPDVLPSDILGFSMYQKEQGTFTYQPGAIMCNLFLADEINRTSPKTQSALLEVMEEGSVTVDGISRPVPDPFVVIATENPVGSVGTQLLPESQLDRFMICLKMGYPSEEDEIAIAKGRSKGLPLNQVHAVIHQSDLVQMRQAVEQVFMEDSIYQYIVALAGETRRNGMIELGVSPRGTIAMVSMAKACAFLKNREYVLPEDVSQNFLTVTAHRIVLNAKARVGHVSAEEVLKQILGQVAAPAIRKRK